MAENPKCPPHTRSSSRARSVVDDHGVIIADPEIRDRPSKDVGWWDHVREIGVWIAYCVNVEKRRPGNMAIGVLLSRIATATRYMKAAVKHAHPWIAETVSKPFRR